MPALMWEKDYAYFFTPGGSAVNTSAMWETQVRSLRHKDPLEKEMATRSSILAWEIPRTEETGGLQSMGSQRVGHDLVTKQQQGYQKVNSNSLNCDK